MGRMEERFSLRNGKLRFRSVLTGPLVLREQCSSCAGYFIDVYNLSAMVAPRVPRSGTWRPVSGDVFMEISTGWLLVLGLGVLVGLGIVASAMPI